MNIPSIIPGTVTSSENSFNVESSACDACESVDFSTLLASFVAAVPQSVIGAESAADPRFDSAESVADNDQVPQEPDESALNPAAILALMAPFSPTITAPEPTTARASETAAIASAPITVDVNVDADHAVNGDAGDQQPVHTGRFSLPLERSLADGALAQDLDGKNDRVSFANEEGSQPQDGNGAVLDAKAPLNEVVAAVDIAAPIDTEMLEHSKSTQSREIFPKIDEPGLGRDKMKPADVLDAPTPTNDSPAAAPREFRSGGVEREVKPAERQTVNDSESFALESPAIEEKAPRLRPSADSQSSFANQHEESSADHSQLKPREMAVDRPDAPPPRLVALPTDVAATKLIQENVAIENAGEPAWQPVVRQVSEEIVRQVRIGEQQAVIELEPPELGKIKIDLRVDGEQIHARIVAEEQSTKALIESRLTELRQALEVRQVDLANLQVEQQNVSSGGQWGQALSDGSRQGRGPWQDDSGFADRSANDAAQRENSQTPASDPGRISMWA